MAKYNPGDYVEVKTNDETYQGIYMPRAEMLEEGILVLKLDSGYNIGISESDIKGVKVLEDYKPKKPKKFVVKNNPDLPTVSILSFGGTISSKVDYKTGGTYADYTAEDFVQMCPELQDIANIKARKVMGMMSEDLTPSEWKVMAEEIEKELKKKDVSGVIITQGTDTLHFSTAALSFYLRDLGKPVVFTAAQRSIDRGSTDAFMNLICSVNAAANVDCAEVMTCLHGTSSDDYCFLIRGTKVRKMHTSRRDAFRPINNYPIAKVYLDGKIETVDTDCVKRSDSKLKVMSDFENMTALHYVYPGMKPGVLEYYVNKGFKGIVIGATALGHVNTEGKYNVLPFIRNAIDAGLVVVIATQTIYGSTHPHVYSNLRKLSVDLGCVFAGDVLPEVAYIKLGWAIANSKDSESAKELFSKNIAGEFKSRRMGDDFLY